MYEVKAVKSFRGREGYGFNASLCRDGKRVALVDDAGNGGCFSYHWLDYKEGRCAEVTVRNHAGVERTRKCTPEEALFVEHVRANTDKTLEPEDMFVAALVDDYEAAKQVRRWCRTKTLFRLKGDDEGSYRTVNAKYSDRVRAFIEGKYGDKVEEIVNERFAA